VGAFFVAISGKTKSQIIEFTGNESFLIGAKLKENAETRLEIGWIVAIPAGTGFWKLDRYPWGGDFGRAKEDIIGKIVSIVDKNISIQTPKGLLGLQVETLKVKTA
jgi:hypothetical protein